MDEDNVQQMDGDMLAPEIDDHGQDFSDVSITALIGQGAFQENEETADAPETSINLEHAEMLREMLQRLFDHPKKSVPIKDLKHMQGLPGCFGWGVVRLAIDKLPAALCSTLVLGHLVDALQQDVIADLNHAHMHYLANLICSFMQSVITHPDVQPEKYEVLKSTLRDVSFWLKQIAMAVAFAHDTTFKIPPPSLIVRFTWLRKSSGSCIRNYATDELGDWNGFGTVQIFLPMQLAMHFAAEMQQAMVDKENFCGLPIAPDNSAQGKEGGILQTSFSRCTFVAEMPPFIKTQLFPFVLNQDQSLRLEQFLREHPMQVANKPYYTPSLNRAGIQLNVFPGKKTPEDKLWPDPSYASIEYFLESLEVLPSLPTLELPEPMFFPTSGIKEFAVQTLSRLENIRNNHSQNLPNQNWRNNNNNNWKQQNTSSHWQPRATSSTWVERKDWNSSASNKRSSHSQEFEESEPSQSSRGPRVSDDHSHESSPSRKVFQ